MSLTLKEQNFFSVGEACKIVGISRPTFLRWVQQGKLTTSITAIEMVGAFLPKMIYQD
jgi:predicted DNA-binding transcriptional regulator AlpA